MIYTTYFAKLDKLPKNITPISIAGKAPDWYTGLQDKRFAPKYSFFIQWKENHDNEFYTKCFNNQVLANKNPQEMYQSLMQRVNTEDIALVCYETPEKFCHRHLVAEWFCQNGIPVQEYQF